MLKAKQNDFNEEQLHLIQSQYDDEKQRSSDLQSRLNETSKLKIELECQLKDLQKKDKEASNTSNTNMQSLAARDDIIEELKLKLAQIQIKLEKDNSKSNLDTKQLQAENEALSKWRILSGENLINDLNK